MQASTQSNPSCFHQPNITINEHHNWNTNSPTHHFSIPKSAIENLTPNQQPQHSSTSTPIKSLTPPVMTGRTSVSSLSTNVLFNHRKTHLTTTSIVTTHSTSPGNVSQSHLTSTQSLTIHRTRSSPRFAQPTVSSSRKKTEPLNHPTPITKQWSPSSTKPKSPNLRCVGKSSTFISTKPNNKFVKTTSTKSLNRSTTCSTISPSKPKTPNLLRRKSMYTRKSFVPGDPNRAFVPNPMPQYLQTGKLPEIKQTRTSQQRAQAHKHPKPSSTNEAPKKPVPSVSLEPTTMKPFALDSVVKHEEHIHQIQRRMETEQYEDKKRREFCPVALQTEILHGPTFVPRRSQVPLTKPVDLLPYAKERSVRTRAFEAEQRARIEETERIKKATEAKRDKLEEEGLRKEYELKRFKPRPVPQSHFKPDIYPVKFENKTIEDNSSVDVCSSHAHSDTTDIVDSEETKKVYDETHSFTRYNPESPVSSENKAVSILKGIRNSLSPLLGRSSSSLS